jgi:hypothetical protein
MKAKRFFLMCLIAALLSAICVGCALVPAGELRQPQAQWILFPSHGTSVRPRTIYYDYPVNVPFGAWGIHPECVEYLNMAKYGPNFEANVYACERGRGDGVIDAIIETDRANQNQQRAIYNKARNSRSMHRY